MFLLVIFLDAPPPACQQISENLAPPPLQNPGSAYDRHLRRDDKSGGLNRVNNITFCSHNEDGLKGPAAR